MGAGGGREGAASLQAFSSTGGKGPGVVCWVSRRQKKPDSGEQQSPQVFKVCLPAGVCLKPGLCTRRVWEKQGVKSVIHKTQVPTGHHGGTDCSRVRAPLEGQAVGAGCVQGMHAAGGAAALSQVWVPVSHGMPHHLALVAVLDLWVLRENSSSSDSGGGLLLRAADSRADSLSLSL